MWNRNLQLTRNLKEAMEMNGHLSRRISPEVGIASLEDKVFSSEEALVFAGGTKEMLEVKAGDFLYAEAKGNYVKVGYRSDSDKEKKITWRLLRATMKQAEEAVSACPFIIRCHRAFLVNIQMVVKVDGNSQGYKLNLEGCEEDVPVSRAYAKEVKALIETEQRVSHSSQKYVVRHKEFVGCHISGLSVPDIFLSYTLPLCLRQETQRM